MTFTGARRKHGPNAKPHGPSHVSRSRNQTFLFMGIMFISATLFTIAISGRRHKLLRRKEEKELKQQGAPILEEQMCLNAERIQVCSHQILNAPPMGLLSLTSPPDGSLQAMESLWRAGIRCFDIDIVTLKDDTLLAAHPSRLAAAVGETKPEQYTIGRAREDGADEVGFPILQEILEKFASLVKKDGEGAFYEHSISPPRLLGPLLSLDLKGPNLNAKLLQDIEDVLEKREIMRNVALCATALEEDEKGPGVDILRVVGGAGDNEKKIHSSIPLGLTLRDRVEKDKDVKRVKSLLEKYSPAIQLLVPSNNFDVEYYDSIIADFGLPLTSWTVDDEAGLLHAIKGGLTAVVSNDPIYLSEILHRLRQRCRQ